MQKSNSSLNYHCNYYSFDIHHICLWLIFDNIPHIQHIEIKALAMSVNSITPTDLKTILHSKRANIYYLEKCRIQVNGGRVEYVTQEGKESFYWNIPIANTTAVMLGMGTSVTQMAMREFARAGVMVGFCGTDGTPLYSANEVDIDVSWLSPQSEYRPTGYLQNWVSFWFDEEKRLLAAKQFQFIRLQQIEKQWAGLRIQRETSFQPGRDALDTILERARRGMENAQDHTSLMLQEHSSQNRSTNW